MNLTTRFPSINIVVMPQHVEKAVINSATADAIALAAQDVGMRNVRVGLWRMTFSQGNDHYVADLPAEATKFIEKMRKFPREAHLEEDKKGKPVPFVFAVQPRIAGEK